jgi:L-serine/L-threonine ammonia-lyase
MSVFSILLGAVFQVACETEGAASFAAALTAGHVVRLPEISTVASTLGALAVTGATLLGPCTTKSCVVTDREAVSACLRFAKEHRVLVEPACGAALAAIYEERHRAAHIAGAARVVVVVCGGSAVSLELLEAWRIRFDL